MCGGRAAVALLCGNVQGAVLHDLSMLLGGGILTWAKALLLPEPATATPAGAVYLNGGGAVMVSAPPKTWGNPCSRFSWNG